MKDTRNRFPGVVLIWMIASFWAAPVIHAQGVINNGAKMYIENGTSFIIADATNGDLTNTDGIITNFGDLIIESDLINNDTLINGSSASAEGRINIDGTVSGTGLSIAERYYASQSNNGSIPDGRWWYITPGVVGATSDSLLDADFPRIWEYDEVSGAWSQITTDISLDSIKGYATRVGTDQTVQYSGTAFFDGTIADSVTNGGNGWNLIGNPYPTTIDIDTVLGWNSSLVFESAWIRTNKQFASWNSASDIGSNGGSQYVSKMQAFWVLCETAGKFEFRDSDKNLQTVSLLKSTATSEKPTLRMVISNDDAGDEAIFAIRNGAEDYFERFDTPKKFGSASAEIFFELATGEQLTANVLPLVPDSGTWKVGVQTKAAGDFEINITEYQDFPETTVVYLDDLQTGSSELIAKGVTYALNLPEGTFSDRLQLRFETVTLVGDQKYIKNIRSPRIYSYLQHIYIHTEDFGTEPMAVKIYDLHGREIYSRQLQGAVRYEFQLNEIPGVYIARLISGEKQFTERVVLSQ